MYRLSVDLNTFLTKNSDKRRHQDIFFCNSSKKYSTMNKTVRNKLRSEECLKELYW